MDPFSAISSVFQIAGVLIAYITDFRNAPKELNDCAIEISHLTLLFTQIRLRAAYCDDTDRKFGDVWQTLVNDYEDDGPIQQYACTLNELHKMLPKPGNKSSAFSHRIRYHFNHQQISRILARLQRTTSIFQLALEMDVSNLVRRIKEDTATIRNDLHTIRRNTDGIKVLQDTATQHNCETILKWLSPLNFHAQHCDTLRQREDGTGRWFLESNDFIDWFRTSQGTLFCPGVPGAGKTIISAVTIDHLLDIASVDGNSAIAFWYCNYHSQREQTAENLLGATLQQLVQQGRSLPTVVQNLYDQHISKGTRPSIPEVLNALETVSAEYQTIYIVIDALDECDSRIRNTLLGTFDRIRRVTDVRLMVTSRFNPGIESKLKASKKLEIRANEHDIRKYVISQFKELPDFVQDDEELQELIVTRIIVAADGMFLLAHLHFDSLLDKQTKFKLRQALNLLAKGSEAIVHAYNEAVQRVEYQLPGNASLARNAIAWIFCAKASLTSRQLCHALGVERGDTDLNEENIPDIGTVVSLCAGLIVFDEELDLVRLVHYTAYEFLQHIRNAWIPHAEAEFAGVCITYLSFSTFKAGPCSSDDDLERRLREMPFAIYAASYWDKHVQAVPEQESEPVLSFLRNPEILASVLQATYFLSYSPTMTRFGEKVVTDAPSQKFVRKVTALHVLAQLGFDQLLLRLLRLEGIDSNSKDDNGQTALHVASQQGNYSVVKVLLDQPNLMPNTEDNNGRSPLSLAAQEGHQAIISLLLGRCDVNVHSRDKEGRTPLSWATEMGHEPIVRVLLERPDINADSMDVEGLTPLFYAAKSGHPAIVRLLLDRDDVDASSMDIWGRTPLHLAAAGGCGCTPVITMLLDHGVDVDAQDCDGGTPFLNAIGRIGTLQYSLDKLIINGYIDVNSKDRSGRTPLSATSFINHEQGYESNSFDRYTLVLERHHPDEPKEDNGNPRLLSMIEEFWNAEAVIRLFLAKDGVDINCRTEQGITPLILAVQQGWNVVVQSLLERDNLNIMWKHWKWGEMGKSAIWWAGAIGREDILQLLLEHRNSDPTSEDHFGNGRDGYSLKYVLEQYKSTVVLRTPPDSR